MRHRKKSKKLNRSVGEREALFRNLAISLLKYQQIKTTKTKARLTQQFVERLISLAKKNTLHSRRTALKLLPNKVAVSELFSKIAPLFEKKQSGFTRVIQYTSRFGDGAQLALLELTEKTPLVKPTEKEKAAVKTTAAAPKKAKVKEKAAPEKTQEEIKPKEKTIAPPFKHKPGSKQEKPKKFISGLRKLFKKERDSL